MRVGGVGSAISAALTDAGARGTTVQVLGTPDAFIPQAKPDAILRQLGLDAVGIAQSAREVLATETTVDLRTV
jgi:deoxyxylulose-5-phosphate synthase